MITPETIVLKFGGTSVRDADAMRRVAAITNAHGSDAKPVVVTSACAGVTDLLLGCACASGAGELSSALDVVQEIRARHLSVITDLKIASGSFTQREVGAMLDEIEKLARGVILLGELTPRTLDLFASFGERLSSVLLAEAFRISGQTAAVADARGFIITDDRHVEARPLMTEIDARSPTAIHALLSEHDVVVTQGFVGATMDGVTTTIGRGGSDFTAALLGAALRSREIQIWTDVSGVLTADPRKVPEARVVPEITFPEARALAYFGAKVIHPDTILPAVARDIPVVIKNSLRPEDPGTRILPGGSSVAKGVHSITMKQDVTVLRVSPREQQSDVQFLNSAVAQLIAHDVPMFCIQSAESHALIAIASTSFTDVVRTAVESTCSLTATDEVTLLCLSGQDMLASADVLARTLTALDGIPITFIAAGASPHIHIIAIDSASSLNALTAVHAALFE